MGSKALNFPFVKTIKLNQKQKDQFIAKEIRAFIDGNKDRLKDKFIIDIIRKMFEEGVLKVYCDKLTPEYQKVLEMI